MSASPVRPMARKAGRSPVELAVRLVRRLIQLHGDAVNNAAAAVRADDSARDARDSAREAVAALEAAALTAARPSPDTSLAGPQYGAGGR
jgi:hypothetical protein